MRYKIWLAALFLISACSSGQGYVQPPSTAAVVPSKTWAPINLTKQQVADVKKGLREGLRDPESARFGTLAAAKASDGEISVCGWVNAKNGFGGYAGANRYIGTLDDNGSFVPTLIGGGDTLQRTIAAFCQARGADIESRPSGV